ncbi:hypothetical protein ACR74Y_12760 [Lacticaseibacillus rhamnosus]|uniref:hypothetical protein n=1 Tax=Lacticaseibacillus rhamnosus TaxID=47715 RepID=UPI000532DC04|nr:hypothetical protein [Lacticaseibacillus rhamnosus]KMO48131.1 hypothetical protein PY95_02295 [Lacticaseibacillus rhamnosus]OAU05507.1 hypothetical protein PY72_02295 [Lacticaseibacillus rhamnosus]
MKKIWVAILGMLVVMTPISIPSLASAATIDLPASAPNYGYVALDDEGAVIDSSSPILTALDQQARNHVHKREAVNFAHSRWVYYSDHHNYFNGYKWSHSNYYHNAEYHTSTAAVSGHDKTTASAKAHNYSVATAAGKGKAQMWYWAPYK